MKNEYQLGHFTVDLGRMFPNPDSRCLSRRKTGTRSGACVVVIDWDKLGYLARRALGSKARKATALHGAIVVKAVPASVTEERLELNEYGLPVGGGA